MKRMNNDPMNNMYPMRIEQNECLRGAIGISSKNRN